MASCPIPPSNPSIPGCHPATTLVLLCFTTGSRAMKDLDPPVPPGHYSDPFRTISHTKWTKPRTRQNSTSRVSLHGCAGLRAWRRVWHVWGQSWSRSWSWTWKWTWACLAGWLAATCAILFPDRQSVSLLALPIRSWLAIFKYDNPKIKTIVYHCWYRKRDTVRDQPTTDAVRTHHHWSPRVSGPADATWVHARLLVCQWNLIMSPYYGWELWDEA